MVNGVQFVMMVRILMMQKLCVENKAIVQQLVKDTMDRVVIKFGSVI